MYTSVTVVQTSITYVNLESNEVVTYQVGGKQTVKECKALIPEGTVFVTKEVEKETFDVITNELLKLKL